MPWPLESTYAASTSIGRRIVDRSSAGPVHMLTVEPDATGATLTYGWDASRLMKMLDAIFAHSDHDLENALATFKREVEALS